MNKNLVGRLLRAENVIERQCSDITDLRARMMRDNIIIKTKGECYKDKRDENTTSVFKLFSIKNLK